MAPRQYKTNIETGRTDIESDLAFLRSRPHSLSSLLPVRPYSLSINEEDYHYSPKPKDLRPARLFRILGSSFDPFWMSVERPSESEIEDGESDKGFDLSASPELTEGAARYQRKLEKEAEDLDLSLFPDDATRLIRAWLVRSATCELSYQWVDLGPVFWPRWLRHTDCEQIGGSQSCSFPSGMSCRRAQVTHIKILAWHCWGGEEGPGRVTDGGLAGPGTGVSVKRCIWRQVPYPVVTACKCSCK
ncbi:noggin-2-like [Megalops cyprinoides]|uniref:noggin-2-like n=1 Tax=Megalops cyprinoides TaxID=118141 RepID=UPI0018650CFF|nr:noggin-2-like [Megalops cyprinoides]